MSTLIVERRGKGKTIVIMPASCGDPIARGVVPRDMATRPLPVVSQPSDNTPSHKKRVKKTFSLQHRDSSVRNKKAFFEGSQLAAGLKK